MTRITLVAAPLLALAACSSLPATTPDPTAIARIEADIVKACTADGLFRPAVQAGVAIAVPAGQLPLSVVEAGIDRICADPARYARDIGAAEQVAKTLRDVAKARAAQR
jgi:hypothetical protein